MEERLIEILVQPNAKKQHVEKYGDKLKIRLTSRAEKGKANNELMEILSHLFGVKKSRIEIIAGKTSRMKTVKVKMY
jgi:uncharacterized protein (TIGR00251 family)